MNIYINGAKSVSPQNSLDYNLFCENVIEHNGKFATAIKPNYKQHFKPIEARRMSKVVKNSVIAAKFALEEAKVEMPDAISVGTGLGIVSDTEKFLQKMIDNNEQFLTPTSFIQSTHNTVAGQIALGLKCHNHNFTFVHRAFSFESALQDAVMQLREGKSNILVGAADEMTDHYYDIIKKNGLLKTEPFLNTDLYKYKNKGAYCGEAQSFFALSSENKPETYAKFIDNKTFYKPKSYDEIKTNIEDFLTHHNLQTSDIDMVILGPSGDYDSDKVYYSLQNDLFMSNYVTYYKHLVGEFHTATGFAFWLATNAIKFNKTPDFISLLNIKPKKINKVLIYNHYFNINHSIFLLSKD